MEACYLSGSSVPALHEGVTEFHATVDEYMPSMYARTMSNALIPKGLLRDLPRADAWSFAREHAVFLNFERRGELE